MAPYFIGVDVGTGSARAGIFDDSGRLMGSAKRAITVWHEAGSIVEQSSEQIWTAVCDSVKEALCGANITVADIAGIGFDATCSLVVVDAEGAPLPVGPSGDPERNIMVWMDHRAAGEAEEINAGDHAVLNYVGGRISPEMETPKLLWLKRNLPQTFAAAGHFFDLADYLTWRASGSLSRSICTVTCKWTYLAHENRWDADYFNDIGLGELVTEGFARIGMDVVEPGSPLGKGLTTKAAADLGLQSGTAVGAALIDAHAGGVGTLGGTLEGVAPDIRRRLAYVFGTSACSMASSGKPVFVNGVWGPYYSAMIPGLWLNEGGQSAAGAAIDHLVSMHPASPGLRAEAEAAGTSLVAWLESEAGRMSDGLSNVVALAGSVHVVPEFLGNRSPHADPEARAIIAGLGLDAADANLVGLYVAGMCGIGYGLRQLLIRLKDDGLPIELIIASGGAAQSDLVRQLLADATNVAVTFADTSEPVLLGASMLAAVAAARYPDLTAAMTAMSTISTVFRPAGGAIEKQHDIRYRAFRMLQNVERDIRQVGRVNPSP
jgi:FGGY-family pentulose kinase